MKSFIQYIIKEEEEYLTTEPQALEESGKMPYLWIFTTPLDECVRGVFN